MEMKTDELSHIDNINLPTEFVKHTVFGTVKAKESSADEKKELANLLMQLPDKIMELSKKKLEFEFRISDLNRSLKRVESEIIQAVQTETDSNGKKRFTNETIRKTELYTRSASDATILRLKSELEHVSNQSKNLDIEIEYENNRFKAARRVVDLITLIEG